MCIRDRYRYDATTYARELLYENTSGLSVGAISPDQRWLALEKPCLLYTSRCV